MINIPRNLAILLIGARLSVGFVPAHRNVGTSPTTFVTFLHANIQSQERDDAHNNLPNTRVNAKQSRRSMLRNAWSIASLVAMGTVRVQPSNAGLVQFPCDYDLMNNYHFLRAGESILESEDLISTNPLFMTNQEDTLSVLGREQIQNACQEMNLRDINPSVVKYSIAAKSIDTANIVADEMLVGRNRLVPEYTFMDPRGVGAWNMRSLSQIEEAVWAMDYLEAGKEGKGGRPPPNDDGTAEETLSDQVIRLRQLMSILETQFSGDEILLIFGDGTSPALLMALMAGLPLNRVHELDLKPGEIRYDVKKSSVMALISDDSNLAAYQQKISQGKETLKELRAELNRKPIKEVYEPPPAVLKKPLKQVEPRERRERSPTSSGSSSGDEFIIPIAALGLGMYASATNKSPNDEIESEGHDRTPISNGVEEVPIDDTSLSPEIQKMEDLISAAPILIPEFDAVKEKEEIEEMKIKIAKDAMEDYLNRDDGADEWLQGLASIIDED